MLPRQINHFILPMVAFCIISEPRTGIGKSLTQLTWSIQDMQGLNAIIERYVANHFDFQYFSILVQSSLTRCIFSHCCSESYDNRNHYYHVWTNCIRRNSANISKCIGVVYRSLCCIGTFYVLTNTIRYI